MKKVTIQCSCTYKSYAELEVLIPDGVEVEGEDDDKFIDNIIYGGGRDHFGGVFADKAAEILYEAREVDECDVADIEEGKPLSYDDIAKALKEGLSPVERAFIAADPTVPLDSDVFKDLMIDPDPDVKEICMQRLKQNLEGQTK
jgi:hypothetical protein